MTTRQFDITFDTILHRMTIRRAFDAGRQLVWDCHTQSDLLDQWFAPKPLTTKTKVMNFTEGGLWHYAMVMPDGQEFWGRMDYQTISPIDGYTLLDGFCDATGTLSPDMPRARWDVSFKDAGARTLVETVVAYGSAAELEQVIAMGMEAGMTSTLERLDELLSTLVN
ncbi:SRPBCC domain-containing protein [Rhodobacter sp. KR11]|jgi:uncharacterized protein YndB with AHSA1/START domain|uniref:SRPBCC family protein n=1 Tax=Rhodobacter sp. KR11 TaxID=2974588 RepID=UPI0022225736|nr:SRPBCC domain-containing protein [Rhodobacter sp. KR11]MCW1918184.1 SRPBCC domain-containing protein [Rhodobacter sp. KR11]